MKNYILKKNNLCGLLSSQKTMLIHFLFGMLLTMNQGRKYVGDFKYGKYDGKGTLFGKDGMKYEGDFEEDKFNGEGIMLHCF